jgi:hypothetical protein
MLAFLTLFLLLLMTSVVIGFCMRRAAPLVAGAACAWAVWSTTHEWVASVSALILVTALMSLILDELAQRPSFREVVLSVEALCAVGFALWLGFAVLYSSGVSDISLVLGVAASGALGLGAWARFRLGY